MKALDLAGLRAQQAQGEASMLRELVQFQDGQLRQAREMGRQLVLAWLEHDWDRMGQLARDLRDGQWTMTGGHE